MNVNVVTELRVHLTPDGRVWTTSPASEPFWRRYLAVFDQVTIVARANQVNTPPESARCMTGNHIHITPLPYYVGPGQYLAQRGRIASVLARLVTAPDAFIFRVPSPLASLAIPSLRRRGHPYGLEVVGDPYDMFAPGAVRHPLRRLFRWSGARNLKHECRGAAAVSYVTAHALQKRYPPHPDAYTTSFSSIELPDDDFVSHPRRFTALPHPRLVMVGSLEQMYKAPDVLIDAIVLCHQRGCALSLTIVGSGKHRAELETRVKMHGLESHITFAGALDHAGVIAALDAADLFVLPSRQEGLPRALIEAMARGLPCIGSTAGGIPELLPEQDMVLPGDADALARKILEVVTDAARLTAMSSRNLEAARAYRNEILNARRTEFYRVIRQQTEVRLNRGAS